MALTNKKNIADKISRLRTHGITTRKELMQKRPENEIWNYQQIELGFNYRMNDIQAALGINQMKRLDDYIKSRHKIAKIYDKELNELAIEKPFQSVNNYSSYHLYPIRVKENIKGQAQKKVYNFLQKHKIFVNIHYIPVHRHPYYEKLGFNKNDFPESEKFHQEVISLPIFPKLQRKQQKFVIEHLVSALKNIKINFKKK